MDLVYGLWSTLPKIKSFTYWDKSLKENVPVFYDINPFSDIYISIFLVTFTLAILHELFVFCSIHAALEAQYVDGLNLHKLKAVNTDTINRVVKYKFSPLSRIPASPDITGI